MKNIILSAMGQSSNIKAGSRVKTLLLAAALSFVTGVSADDTDLFFGDDAPPPNILFVLDNSGSMIKVDDGDGVTRIAKVQTALRLLVTTLEDVNVGLIEYAKAPELTVPIGEISANQDELLDAIDAMTPKGGTGTQEAIWEGRSYLRGELQSPVGTTYPSPIEFECQQNHIIVMTDGTPTADLNRHEVYDDVVGFCASVENDPADRRKCGEEIAAHLLAEDLNETVRGKNFAQTHTIGFELFDPWLQAVATAGDGEFFEVSSAEGLVAAILDIIDGVGTTFAAPAIPPTSFNESRHREELYYSQFQSSRSVRWNGNIKKYKLQEVLVNEGTNDETTTTLIVDANEIPLIVQPGETVTEPEEIGQIRTTSRNLWLDATDAPDGSSVPDGGFAHKLPSFFERNWYTDYNSKTPVRVGYDDSDPNVINADLDALLPVESLGADDEAERNALVSWALGRDLEGYQVPTAAAASAAASAAAGIDAENRVNTAAIEKSNADLAFTIADAAYGDAQIQADTLNQAATDAAAAVDTAIADNTANLAELIQISDITGRDADAAAVTANALKDVVIVAQERSIAAKIDLQIAELSTAPTIGAANDGNQNLFFAADSLHNTPILASYFTESDTGTRGEILFSANNLGVLHAIDPATGIELWSYSPEEHLGNIKEYYKNEDRPDHVYGLDGDFLLHTTTRAQEGYDFWVDNALLYMTERRGGNRVYALDVSDGLTADLVDRDPFSIMWKITGGEDGTDGFADLAQTWSKPKMIDVTVNCPDNCQTKELLMFSGGYNADVYDEQTLNYDAMSVPSDGHGNAVYLVDPKTGELAWSVGNGADHSLNLAEMNHSIPSTPVPVDTNFDGSIDVLFFVDIGGDVWRVDLGTEGDTLNELHIAGGKIAELSPQGQSLRFFNPLDVVVSGTNVTTSFFSLVTGTGMRSSPLFEEPNPNRLYSIKDRWLREVPFRVNANGNKEYDYRYVSEVGGDFNVITADDSVLKNVSDSQSTTSTTYGFFRTFQPGEKVLQPTRVTNNLILMNSYVPPETHVGINCNYDIGETRLRVLSLLDGENALSPNYGGDGSGSEFIVVGDGILAAGQIIDTGKGDAPFYLVGSEPFTIKELTAPNNQEIFRRFRRTGWVELD